MLSDKWFSLWKRAGGRDSGWQRPYERLVERYSEPHRHYHTLAHIQHCLEEFEAVRTAAEDMEAVEMALWFHDAVYDPKAKGNEQESARLARIVLDVGGFGDRFCRKVEDMVLATVHDAEPLDPDAAVLCDVDLAILGAPPGRFDEYERQIRREYGWVPDEDYIRGRSSILERFLARPFLFATKVMRGKYEANAHGNLTRSLERLRQGHVIT